MWEDFVSVYFHVGVCGHTWVCEEGLGVWYPCGEEGRRRDLDGHGWGRQQGAFTRR